MAFSLEKPPPAAIGSGEHPLFVLLKCIPRSAVLPRRPRAAPRGAPGSAPRFAGQRAASSPSRYPTWYRSRRRLLDNGTADTQLVQTPRQAERSRKGLFSFFSSFFSSFSQQQRAAASEILRAATAAAPSRAPAARPRCSVRNADPLDIVISVNICRCFRAGSCVWPGTPAGSVAFSHGFPSLRRKRQMIPMDHGGRDKCLAEMTCGLQPTEQPFFLKKCVLSSY